MKETKLLKSRKHTVWGDREDITSTQSFVREKIKEHYEQRHPLLRFSGERDLINSFVPKCCPVCHSEQFKKNGLTTNGIQRYLCKCGASFLPTTGTIFDSHKISISEWIEYSMNLFRHVSLNADSWNNRNSLNTSRYWLKKMFLILAGSQDKIVFSDTVWIDETYYALGNKKLTKHQDGTKLRGISRNQMCIGVATDDIYSMFILEGVGKPTQDKTYTNFRDHIKPGTTLIHDKENSHRKLVQELSLNSIEYSSKDLRGLPDKDNPLEPVNRQHRLLKHFLRAHSGFSREDLQGYLNLFAYVTNPPMSLEEKVANLLETTFKNPKLLRYRECFRINTASVSD